MCELVNPNDWTNLPPQFEVYVSTGAALYKMVVDADTDLFGTEAPDGIFGVTGIGGQRDDEAPFLDGYTILPRGAFDLSEPVSADFTAPSPWDAEDGPVPFQNLSKGAGGYFWSFGDGSPLDTTAIAVPRVPRGQHVHGDPHGRKRRWHLHGPGVPGGHRCLPRHVDHRNRGRACACGSASPPVRFPSAWPVPLRLECGVDLTTWALVDAAGRTVRSGGRVVAGAPWTLEAEGLIPGWHALVCTAMPMVAGGPSRCWWTESMRPSRAILLLHATVVVFGFTGVLGKLIVLPAVPLVFWRTLIGALGLHVWMLIRRRGKGIPSDLILPVAGTGVWWPSTGSPSSRPSRRQPCPSPWL